MQFSFLTSACFECHQEECTAFLLVIATRSDFNLPEVSNIQQHLMHGNSFASTALYQIGGLLEARTSVTMYPSTQQPLCLCPRLLLHTQGSASLFCITSTTPLFAFVTDLRFSPLIFRAVCKAVMPLRTLMSSAEVPIDLPLPLLACGLPHGTTHVVTPPPCPGTALRRNHPLVPWHFSCASFFPHRIGCSMVVVDAGQQFRYAGQYFMCVARQYMSICPCVSL